MNKKIKHLLSIVLTFALFNVNANTLERFDWTQINDGASSSFGKRAGLQAIELNGKFYVLGGRVPDQSIPAFGNSQFYSDVWQSSDYGATWQEVVQDGTAPWAARAYFQAFKHKGYIYLLGGQDSIAVNNPGFNVNCLPQCQPFVLQSNFFNDVWRSKDGKNWQRMTAAAPWEGRAGLSAVSFRGWIYVMAGSVNDDSAIIGDFGPARKYFNDVWRSKNGRHWQKVTMNAPWEPRAGGVALVKGGYMYMIGGEDGFVCNEFTPRCPPYFNDVWRSKNGKRWQKMTANAPWSARPGHQCEVLMFRIVCFGGFGLSPDPTQPFAPANPIDVWVSFTGKHWQQLSGDAGKPWQANSPADIKYDFAAFSVVKVNGRFKPSIYTFGGDRETFDPFDFDQISKVDNDVWRFSWAYQLDKRRILYHFD
ncbi:Kelch repeat-containing protein [Thalassotalea agarivorans]|uniref:Kelch motif-containing protein n=1 Tax=Thalassotalea agarivorans TaxID=349064 RepID=A0A1I0BKL7_THASX|nr:hypothetical protein [Thalassotalea agarivorans]SET07205.1 hypothetical protein SAMN05660429_00973 [Thalassotalea agarivorans]